MLVDRMDRTGHVPVGLFGPEVPVDLAHVWRWFIELDEARAMTMGGVAPISFGEIKAWAELTDRQPTAAEVRLIRRIDRARIRNI